MKVYKIKVNGKTYKVELEAIEEHKSAAAAAPAAAEAKKPEPAAAPASSGPAEGKEVLSPIQGQVVKILVKPGDTVKKGTVLVIIEAMKLENEVVSPFDGEVASVLVNKGQNVSSKERIITIR